jgi:hypothetical protein
LAKDPTEAARFTEKMPWEPNFNSGNYLGIKTFEMNPGDKFALMFVPNTSIEDINKAKGISSTSQMWQFGKLPLFSIPEANHKMAVGQIVDVDGNGTFAFEDIPIGSSTSDRDYNDFIFQIKGASGIAQSIDNFSNPDRNWRTTNVGQQLLEYANRAIFDEGVFAADQTGNVTIDFVYDGGEYQKGEVGIFSLKGMDMYEAGSDAFIQEAIRRATSNSTDGYVVIKDAEDGGLYSDNSNILYWEPNFNGGTYQGKQTYQMNAGDAFGFILMSNGTFQDALTGQSFTNSNRPLFSMSGANFNDHVHVAEVLTGSNGVMIGFEDVALHNGSNRDYNDFVINVGGVQSFGITDIKDVMVHYHNWVDTQVGADLSNYFNTGNVPTQLSTSVVTNV